MKVDTSVKWYSGKKLKLLNYPDKITYETARMMLDVSYTKIPLATTVGAGKLRQSSTSAGVRGSKGNYYIGCFCKVLQRSLVDIGKDRNKSAH